MAEQIKEATEALETINNSPIWSLLCKVVPWLPKPQSGGAIELARDSVELARDTVEAMKAATEDNHALMSYIAERQFQTNNVRRIAERAYEIADEPKPDEVEQDWGNHFAEKCRNISNSSMSERWSRIAAGEFDNPGSISRNTLNVMDNLDAPVAAVFDAVCQYSMRWAMGDRILLIWGDENEGGIYDPIKPIEPTLRLLAEVGLVEHTLTAFNFNLSLPGDNPAGTDWVLQLGRHKVCFNYPSSELQLGIGKYRLTTAGQEIARILPKLAPTQKFVDYARIRLEQAITQQGGTLIAPPQNANKEGENA